MLRHYFSDLVIRVINVIDLLKIASPLDSDQALSNADYDELFTQDKPILFGFHGYVQLVYSLTFQRTNHNMLVRGYQEEGTISTPFDVRVQNGLDRFHLVQDAIDLLPQLGTRGANVKQIMKDKLTEHTQYINQHGQDLPEVQEWK